ncbi:MAG: hypothetical protein PHF37_07895 [Phycisphaerae bacterium]|nr:hypothetical protein [Phycisphaerae bacterium]
MKFLKWKDTIQETCSKEEILHKVERAEIMYNVWGGCYTLMTFLGIAIILLAPSSSKGTFLGLALYVCSVGGLIENSIKSHLKLERYKALWDKMELLESEERKTNAQDL